jgi:P4 family phage/plasmid primase-like protien
MDSSIRRDYDIYTPDEIYQRCYHWNQKHCKPPLDDKEFEKQWLDASRYIRRKLADNNSSGGIGAAATAAATAGVDGKMLIEEMKGNDPHTKIKNYLTEEVIKRISLRTLLDTGEILYYDSKEKVWRFNGERMIDVEIEKIADGPVVTSHMKKEVQKHIMDNRTLIVPRSAFDGSFDIINLENCRLNIITEKPLPQTPEENLTLSKSPIRYDPYAECPHIEKFLGEVIIEPHKLKEVLKFWSYILLKDCRFEKALMLLGGGSNGKSVLIKLLEAAVGGDENCSHGSLHDFEEDKFARAELFGKLLNTYADLKSAKLRETCNIKTLISGDSVEAQFKFKPRFKFRNKAKIIVSTNKPPETEDKTHAFYRRWLIVTFDRTFTDSEDRNDPNKKDTNLLAKLTTPEELSGFLNLGLKYLQVLIKENGFAEEAIDKIRREYEFKADHVARYLQDCCIIDFNKKDYETKTETLYNHYVRWCSERDQIIALDENVFGSKLTEHGIQKKRKTFMGEGRQYVYKPIVLRHVLQEEMGQADTITTALEKSAALTTTREETMPEIIECHHCALENEAGNSPLFTAKSAREVQLHILFKHPGEDFDVITRV